MTMTDECISAMTDDQLRAVVFLMPELRKREIVKERDEAILSGISSVATETRGDAQAHVYEPGEANVHQKGAKHEAGCEGENGASSSSVEQQRHSLSTTTPAKGDAISKLGTSVNQSGVPSASKGPSLVGNNKASKMKGGGSWKSCSLTPACDNRYGQKGLKGMTCNGSSSRSAYGGGHANSAANYLHSAGGGKAKGSSSSSMGEPSPWGSGHKYNNKPGHELLPRHLKHRGRRAGQRQREVTEKRALNILSRRYYTSPLWLRTVAEHFNVSLEVLHKLESRAATEEVPILTKNFMQKYNGGKPFGFHFLSGQNHNFNWQRADLEAQWLVLKALQYSPHPLGTNADFDWALAGLSGSEATFKKLWQSRMYAFTPRDEENVLLEKSMIGGANRPWTPLEPGSAELGDGGIFISHASAAAGGANGTNVVVGVNATATALHARKLGAAAGVFNNLESQLLRTATNGVCSSPPPQVSVSEIIKNLEAESRLRAEQEAEAVEKAAARAASGEEAHGAGEVVGEQEGKNSLLQHNKARYGTNPVTQTSLPLQSRVQNLRATVLRERTRLQEQRIQQEVADRFAVPFDSDLETIISMKRVVVRKSAPVKSTDEDGVAETAEQNGAVEVDEREEKIVRGSFEAGNAQDDVRAVEQPEEAPEERAVDGEVVGTGAERSYDAVMENETGPVSDARKSDDVDVPAEAEENRTSRENFGLPKDAARENASESRNELANALAAAAQQEPEAYPSIDDVIAYEEGLKRSTSNILGEELQEQERPHQLPEIIIPPQLELMPSQLEVFSQQELRKATGGAASSASFAGAPEKLMSHDPLKVQLKQAQAVKNPVEFLWSGMMTRVASALPKVFVADVRHEPKEVSNMMWELLEAYTRAAGDVANRIYLYQTAQRLKNVRFRADKQPKSAEARGAPRREAPGAGVSAGEAAQNSFGGCADVVAAEGPGGAAAALSGAARGGVADDDDVAEEDDDDQSSDDDVLFDARVADDVDSLAKSLVLTASSVDDEDDEDDGKTLSSSDSDREDEEHDGPENLEDDTDLDRALAETFRHHPKEAQVGSSSAGGVVAGSKIRVLVRKDRANGTSEEVDPISETKDDETAGSSLATTATTTLSTVSKRKSSAMPGGPNALWRNIAATNRMDTDLLQKHDLWLQWCFDYGAAQDIYNEVYASSTDLSLLSSTSCVPGRMMAVYQQSYADAFFGGNLAGGGATTGGPKRAGISVGFQHQHQQRSVADAGAGAGFRVIGGNSVSGGAGNSSRLAGTSGSAANVIAAMHSANSASATVNWGAAAAAQQQQHNRVDSRWAGNNASYNSCAAAGPGGPHHAAGHSGGPNARGMASNATSTTHHFGGGYTHSKFYKGVGTYRWAQEQELGSQNRSAS
eukprot:g5565.t1